MICGLRFENTGMIQPGWANVSSDIRPVDAKLAQIDTVISFEA